jgi:hypothetical protein
LGARWKALAEEFTRGDAARETALKNMYATDPAIAKLTGNDDYAVIRWIDTAIGR